MRGEEGDATLEIVLALVALLPFAALLLWLLNRPGDEDEEELAGLVAETWPHAREWLERDP